MIYIKNYEAKAFLKRHSFQIDLASRKFSDVESIEEILSKNMTIPKNANEKKETEIIHSRFKADVYKELISSGIKEKEDINFDLKTNNSRFKKLKEKQGKQCFLGRISKSFTDIFDFKQNIGKIDSIVLFL